MYFMYTQSNTELHSRLSTALQENMKLRRQALEGFAGSITADSQSSHFVAKSNPSAIGDIALDTKPPFPPCHQEESDYSVESDRNIYNSDPKSPACGLLSPVQESRPPSPVQSPTSTGAEIASDVTAIAYTVPGIRLASSPKSSNCSTNTKLRPLVGKYKVDSSFIGIQPKKSVTTNEKEVKKQTPLAACITPSLCNYSKDHIAEKAKVVEVNVANALEHANEIFMRQRERQILEQTKHNPGNVCQSQTVSRTTFEDGCIQVLSADDSSSDLPIPDINEVQYLCFS